MKKVILVILCITLFSKSNFAQDSIRQSQLSLLLSNYYDIKDALVEGRPAAASLKAVEFVKTLNGVDYKVISEGNVNALLMDAGAISETKDLKRQREYFANFSNNMVALAKAIKLGSAPVYQQYCPMKKTYWLSRDMAIKNPYYGSAMLTCGQIIDTLK
jgi:hypothetical protein